MTTGATIKDVAKRAGVSVGTVSKILNGGSCSGERARRIHEAIRALNYRPNLFARAVRSSRSNCLGLLLEKNVYSDSGLWLEGWLSSLLQAIALTDFRCEVLTVDSEDDSLDCSKFHMFDGLVSFGHFSEKFWEKMRAVCTVPLVTYFEKADYPYGFTYPVHLDDAMAKIARHLYDYGHRHVAFVSSDNEVAQTKMTKFKEAMQRLYPQYNADLLLSLSGSGNATEFGMKLTDEVLLRHPEVTTIFYVSDSYANGGLCALMQRRLRLVHDISIVSYDHTTWAENYMPRITGVGINFRQMTQLLVELLVAIIKEDDAKVEMLKAQQIMLEYFPGDSVRNLREGNQ